MMNGQENIKSVSVGKPRLKLISQTTHQQPHINWETYIHMRGSAVKNTTCLE